jgi:hypothetical protein
VRFHPVGNGVGLYALVTDLGIVNATNTAPPGVVCIQIPHDYSGEVGMEFG